MHDQWEYQVLKLQTDVGFFAGTDFDTAAFREQLNHYGAQGWELVSVFDIEKIKGGSKFVVATLKRRRGDTADS